VTAIDPEQVLTALTAAVNEAMEAMFFDAAEPEPDPCGAEEADAIVCRVHFHDAMEGEFRMAMPRETATALASSALAVEAADVAPAQAEQTVCELANIVCGAALSRLEPGSELRLGAPEIVPALRLHEDGAVHQHYRLLDGCLALTMQFLSGDASGR